MKSIYPVLSTPLAVLALLGCATPYRAPGDAVHIKLERADSPVIIVEKIWLDRTEGPLAVTGYVLRRLEAEDTTKTHLDVTLFDSTGGVLRSSVGQFEPKQIPRRVAHHRHARYRVELGAPPAEIARIEVRAHEGQH